MTPDQIRQRANAVQLAKSAYHRADEALDKFAASKDEEGMNYLAMARDEINEALRLLRLVGPTQS